MTTNNTNPVSDALKALLILALTAAAFILIARGLTPEHEISLIMGITIGLLAYLKGNKWAQDEADQRSGISGHSPADVNHPNTPSPMKK